MLSLASPTQSPFLGINFQTFRIIFGTCVLEVEEHFVRKVQWKTFDSRYALIERFEANLSCQLIYFYVQS